MTDARVPPPQSLAVVGSLAHSLVNFRGPMIRDFVENGARVTGMAPGSAPTVADALQRLGADYVPFMLDRTGTHPGRDLLSVRSLWSQFRALRPDLVLAYTMKPVVYGLLAARAAGVRRRVAMITGLGYAFGEGGGARQQATSAVLKRLTRLALVGAEAVLFQNPDDQAFFEESGLLDPRTRVLRVAGTGVDLDYYAQVPVALGPPRFLFMGRLLREKGVPEFAAAASRVRQDHPEAEFHILGALDANPGSVSAEELAGYVASGVVHHDSTDDVRPLLAAASVFVLPTAYREGVPRSIQEALAVGRAVITTDRPGCRETVEDGTNGFLVPAHDAEALARAMRRFAEAPGLATQMGQASRELAERCYDVDLINAEILDLLGFPSQIHAS